MSGVVEPIWKGRALLAWGDRDGDHEKTLTFTIDHVGPLEEKPRLTLEEVRREMTLRLVCREALRRYALPPKTVRIWIDGEDPTDCVMARARWRAGSGFCYGAGIVRVTSPSFPAGFAELQEVN